MLASEIRNSALIDELQLGQSLNHAVNSSDQASFALMLAMISDNAMDLPKEEDAVSSAGKAAKADLRMKFELPPEIRLQSGEGDALRGESLGDDFRNGGLESVFLSECLFPEPLTVKHDDLPETVLGNMSPVSRARYEIAREGREPKFIPVEATPADVLDETVSSEKLNTVLEAA